MDIDLRYSRGSEEETFGRSRGPVGAAHHSEQTTMSKTTMASSDDQTLNLQAAEPLALAQALAQQLAITPMDWHRLNSDRRVRAKEQVAAALVYLLNDNPEEALPRLEQAVGWLNRSIKAPPCPTHGEHK